MYLRLAPEIVADHETAKNVHTHTPTPTTKQPTTHPLPHPQSTNKPPTHTHTHNQATNHTPTPTTTTNQPTTHPHPQPTNNHPHIRTHTSTHTCMVYIHAETDKAHCIILIVIYTAHTYNVHPSWISPTYVSLTPIMAYTIISSVLVVVTRVTPDNNLLKLIVSTHLDSNNNKWQAFISAVRMTLTCIYLWLLYNNLNTSFATVIFAIL